MADVKLEDLIEGHTEVKDDETYDIHEWKVGDILAGLLIGKKTITTENGESVIYSVEVDDLLVKEFGGERISFWGSALLDTRLKNCEPGVEHVVIEYMGLKKSSKGGRSYHDFRVFHKTLDRTDAIDPEEMYDKDLPFDEEEDINEAVR